MKIYFHSIHIKSGVYLQVAQAVNTRNVKFVKGFSWQKYWRISLMDKVVKLEEKLEKAQKAMKTFF